MNTRQREDRAPNRRFEIAFGSSDNNEAAAIAGILAAGSRPAGV